MLEDHFTHRLSPPSAAAISSGIAARQYLRTPLREHAHKELLSGAKPTPCTPISFPGACLMSNVIVHTSCMIRRFHSLIVPSILQLANVAPSGEKARSVTLCACPYNR